MRVVKRTGEVEKFNPEKIVSAVHKAMSRTEYNDESLGGRVVEYVLGNLEGCEEQQYHVDEVHKTVENALMDIKVFDVAREYVTYRNNHLPDVFRERKAYKPFEYPQFTKYQKAIHQSFWVVDEFNFTSDVQEFHAELSEKEQTVIKRTMLAISQIESQFVKTFWGRLFDRIPKPEVADVGAAFSNNESIHAESYSRLLEVLGLNEEFDKLDQIECLNKRRGYLSKFVSPKDASNKEFMKSILMFSMFIENVSLFGQFLIMTSFDKHKNMLTGIGNVVQSTACDESIHGMFGAELLNTIREENPEWFDEALVEETHEACRESMKAESEILDWIFEKGDLSFITKEEVKDYLRWRFNKSMDMIYYPHVFNVEETTKEKFEWFEMQVLTTTNPDFFARRSVNYTKVNHSYDEDSLF